LGKLQGHRSIFVVAAMGLEMLDEIEGRIDEFSDRLLYFSSYLNSAIDKPARMPDNLFHVPDKGKSLINCG